MEIKAMACPKCGHVEPPESTKFRNVSPDGVFSEPVESTYFCYNCGEEWTLTDEPEAESGNYDHSA